MSGGKFGGFMGKIRSQVETTSQSAGAMLREGREMAATGGAGLKQSFSLPGESQKAAKILRQFLADPEQPATALNSIPKAVLQRAKGLAVFTILKAGFVFSGKAGSGLVVARLPDGSWSAPSCIATAGLGWGLQIGADLTEVVIVLNSDEAVKAFSRGGNVTVGGGVSAAAGPIGTGGQISASLANPAPMFSYSKSKGLFAGLALDGTILVERKDANREFYGSNISSTDILTGRVPAPEIASAMYDIIESAEGIDESSLPQESYIPNAQGQQMPVSAAGPGTAAAPPSAGLGQGYSTTTSTSTSASPIVGSTATATNNTPVVPLSPGAAVGPGAPGGKTVFDAAH